MQKLKNFRDSIYTRVWATLFNHLTNIRVLVRGAAVKKISVGGAHPTTESRAREAPHGITKILPRNKKATYALIFKAVRSVFVPRGSRFAYPPYK